MTSVEDDAPSSRVRRLPLRRNCLQVQYKCVLYGNWHKVKRLNNPAVLHSGCCLIHLRCCDTRVLVLHHWIQVDFIYFLLGIKQSLRNSRSGLKSLCAVVSYDDSLSLGIPHHFYFFFTASHINPFRHHAPGQT